MSEDNIKTATGTSDTPKASGTPVHELNDQELAAVNGGNPILVRVAVAAAGVMVGTGIDLVSTYLAKRIKAHGAARH